MYSEEVKDYCNFLKIKKNLGAYSHPKNIKGTTIKAATKFLDGSRHNSMRHRICYILNGIDTIIKCPVCDNDDTNIIINKDMSYIVRGCCVKCSAHIDKTFINPETGMSNYSERNHKGANTKRHTFNENDENIFQISGKKCSKTLSIVNDDGIKYSKSRSIKQQATVMKKDEFGNYRAKEIAKKSAKTMRTKKVKGSDLTIAEDIGRQNSEHAKNGDSYKLGRKKTQEKIDLIKYPKILKKIEQEDLILLTTFDEYKKGIRLLKVKCNKCDSISEIYRPYFRCINCKPKSKEQLNILNFINNIIDNIATSNNRKILESKQELDIYIKQYNCAIEYDGLIFHSFGKSKWSATNNAEFESDGKNNHLNKTRECKNQGIQLFHIFENEWLDPIKQKIWKSIIRNKLGQSTRLYARKTKVAQVTSSERKKFLIDNHLQGNCVSSVNLGLYLGDELISLMTFSKSRFSKKYDWELLRFCNKIGYSVVGGASKLLKAFQRKNGGSIVSYADKRRSAGNLYKQLGFELSHESSPNYFYFKDPMVLESRIKYQKHKLKDKLEIFDENLTESENMYANGYRKIYDCGNQVWIFE